jgi:putative polyketide hydroxylase
MDLVRGGLGDDSVELRYLGHRVWQPTALVADHYHSGRVFLAGDAAHVTTPEGGLGMNCGVADAHNLAWKLAGVLAGWASPRLLDSYRAERRPHALACVEASLGTTAQPIDGLVLGHVYQSAVITNDHTAPPTTRDPVGEYLPAGRPGHRAPHLWLHDGRSILDLFGHVFVALTDPAGKQSLDAAAASARRTRIPLAVWAIDAAGWQCLYGVEPGGVVPSSRRIRRGAASGRLRRPRVVNVQCRSPQAANRPNLTIPESAALGSWATARGGPRHRWRRPYAVGPHTSAACPAW